MQFFKHGIKLQKAALAFTGKSVSILEFTQKGKKIIGHFICKKELLCLVCLEKTYMSAVMPTLQT